MPASFPPKQWAPNIPQGCEVPSRWGLHIKDIGGKREGTFCGRGFSMALVWKKCSLGTRLGRSEEEV